MDSPAEVKPMTARLREPSTPETYGPSRSAGKKGLLGVVRAKQNKTGRNLPVKRDRSPSSDVSGKAVDLRSVLKDLKKYLLLADPDAFLILLGAAAAFAVGLDPVWLLIVGPPSGGKTEFLRMLNECPMVYPLSELTPRTLASGLLMPDGRDASLLLQVNSKILVLKDLTTLLEMRRDDRQEVLAQLREIYDGRFTKAWGTGQRLDWSGRVGFIAGVTSVIDQHHQVMGMLGQRFILVR